MTTQHDRTASRPIQPELPGPSQAPDDRSERCRAASEDWRLDEQTRGIGLRGVALARARLAAAPRVDRARAGRRGDREDQPAAPPERRRRYGRAHADRCRAPRLPARRQAAHPQLRRPRPLPRRHRGCLRRPARGDRHQRLADRPGPVGPGVGLPLPGGRRRGPADPQRRARPVPLGPDHPGPVPARRGRGIPPHR